MSKKDAKIYRRAAELIHARQHCYSDCASPCCALSAAVGKGPGSDELWHRLLLQFVEMFGHTWKSIGGDEDQLDAENALIQAAVMAELGDL